MKKKLLAVLLVSSMAASLAACGSGNTGSAASTGSQETAAEEKESASEASAEAVASAKEFDGCLNIAIPADPTDLNPFVTMSVGRMYTLETVFEYLGAYVEKNGEFKGQLAKDIELSEDAKTVTVTLYDYINDSAGNHITAQDVLWCYDKAIETQCSISTSYIDTMEVTGDYTIVFHLNNATVNGWQSVLSAIPIVSQAAYEASADSMSQDPVTTSAYVVDKFVSGSSLHMTKRDDYWQTDDSLLAIHSYPDEIEFDVVLEASQMSIALETGTVELAEGMSTNEIARFREGGEKAGEFAAISTPDSRIYTLLFNMSDEGYFHDKPVELRQAIAKAIDSAGLVQGVLNGGGDVCTIPASINSDDYDAATMSMDYLTYDPTEAKALLEAAGYKAGDITLRLATENGGNGSATCELIQAYLMEIGIDTTINVVDSGLFNNVKYDSSEWDLLVDGIGGQNIATYAHQWDVTGHDYFNGSLIYDEKMQELVETVQNVPTHNADSVMAWMNYAGDVVYFKSLYNGYSYVAAVPNIDNVKFTNRSCVYPGDVQFK